MSKFMPSVVFLCSLCFSACTLAQPQTVRKTLDRPTVVQGYPCEKGYAWFYPGGQLEKCTVTRAIAFGEATLPAGSWITVAADGKPKFAQMPHDAPVRGLMCQGGGWLGPSEGSMVVFYPSGKLKICYLAKDRAVDGVPCSHGGFFATLFGADPGVYFNEDGTLRQCRLAKDFADRPKGSLYQPHRM